MKPRDGLRLHEDEHVGKGLEALTVADMTGRQQPTTGTEPASGGFSEEPESFVGFHNWLFGDPKAYDRAWTVDLVQLRAFIAATQPRCWRSGHRQSGSSEVSCRSRLQGEIGKRGVIDVLRNGVKHGQHDINLFYGPPPAAENARLRQENQRLRIEREI